MQGTVPYKLKKPIVWKGKQSGDIKRSIESLTFRRPDGKDMVELESMQSRTPIKWTFAMIARLSGITVEDACKLDLVDSKNIQALWEKHDFFGLAEPETETPETDSEEDEEEES